MDYSKPISFFLLFLGLFSLAMNFSLPEREFARAPSSVASVESDSGANYSPPWWITH
jgi:hypothetical protein